MHINNGYHLQDLPFKLDIELLHLLNILVYILLLRPFWLIHFCHPNIGGGGSQIRFNKYFMSITGMVIYMEYI